MQSSENAIKDHHDVAMQFCERTVQNDDGDLTAILFKNGYSVLSNFHYTPFFVDGVRYRNVEQFLHAKRAILFRDYFAVDAIMREKETRKYQEYKVKGQCDDTWAEHAPDILQQGLLPKFKQNEQAQNKLLSTDSAMIAYSTPHDHVYGTGLNIDNDDNLDSSKWQGTTNTPTIVNPCPLSLNQFDMDFNEVNLDPVYLNSFLHNSSLQKLRIHAFSGWTMLLSHVTNLEELYVSGMGGFSTDQLISSAPALRRFSIHMGETETYNLPQVVLPSSLTKVELRLNRKPVVSNVNWNFPDVTDLDIKLHYAYEYGTINAIADAFPNIVTLTVTNDDCGEEAKFEDKELVSLRRLPILQVLKVEGFSNVQGRFLRRGFDSLHRVYFKNCPSIIREIEELDYATPKGAMIDFDFDHYSRNRRTRLCNTKGCHD